MAPPRILLVEPHFVLRRTIVTVARELGVGELHEAATTAMALPLLASRTFQGVVLDTGEQGPALHLLARLRAGDFASPAHIPVLALSAATDRAVLDPMLTPHGVHATLCKPFKVAELLQLLRQMTR